MNSSQRLKLIFHIALKFKILLLNGLTLQRNLRFAFKYRVLSGAGCSAGCSDLGAASSSHLSREKNPDTWQHLARVESELRGTWSPATKVGDVGEMLDPRWTFLGAGGW